jgi:hypothetical protein
MQFRKKFFKAVDIEKVLNEVCISLSFYDTDVSCPQLIEMVC